MLPRPVRGDIVGTDDSDKPYSPVYRDGIHGRKIGWWLADGGQWREHDVEKLDALEAVRDLVAHEPVQGDIPVAEVGEEAQPFVVRVDDPPRYPERPFAVCSQQATRRRRARSVLELWHRLLLLLDELLAELHEHGETSAREMLVYRSMH